MSTLRERIIDVLISRKLVTREQLDEALEELRSGGGNLQRILVGKKLVQESDLIAAMSQGLGIPPISLGRLKLDAKLKELISKDIAVQYELVPVSRMGQTLTVAMADPLNVFALDTLTALTGLNINTLLTTSKDIEEAIERFYGSSIEQSLKDVFEADGTDMEILEEDLLDESDAEGLLKQTQETPVIRFTEALLNTGVKLKASDIMIEPCEKKVRVRYRVDGILQEGKSPPKSMHTAVVSRVKVLSDLNIAERRIPQDGHFSYKVGDRTVDFRVSVLPVSFGENVCLRVQDKKAAKLDIDSLGFSENDLERLKRCALRPHGMILATGPTGTGKTTTLYSLLNMIDTPESNLVTVEDPVEFEFKGINQVNVKADIGMTFSAALRSILRQDPDVVMVGEIRDTETADMAIKAALTGHLVLSTLHTNNAVGTITRLANMGVAPFLINTSVMAVVAQRLVRKVCQQCAEAYVPGHDLAQQLELLDDKGKPCELLKAVGCKACAQSGYSGREVIAEVLVLTPEIRELILKRVPEREIELQACKQGMRTLRQHGIEKVKQKKTTLEEVFRMTVGNVVEEE